MLLPHLFLEEKYSGQGRGEMKEGFRVGAEPRLQIVVHDLLFTSGLTMWLISESACLSAEQLLAILGEQSGERPCSKTGLG